MPLEEYQRKRDFSKTPEPSGKVSRSRAPERFFCVQKHLASHLHYDLRLEHNGVLLSWAVPKGPSLDPKTKRLAMHVEDHPIEYGDFEGVIPEGYGAGIVMLWDRGTWKPEVDDVDAALKKGDLKFTLTGYKLKGSWVLVRTGGRYPGARGASETRSWLLIKHRDEWSGDLDITEFAPRSVKCDGDFEDILADGTPAIWLSNRPARGGDSGAMLAQIIERAAKLKAAREEDAPSRKTPRPVRVPAVTKTPSHVVAKKTHKRPRGSAPSARTRGQAAKHATTTQNRSKKR
jgi:bifunctional non-homologous end joining protein LigD